VRDAYQVIGEAKPTGASCLAEIVHGAGRPTLTAITCGSWLFEMRNFRNTKEGQDDSNEKNNTGSSLPGFVMPHLDWLRRLQRYIMFDQYPSRDDNAGVPR
jgi:hypothetical protein